MRTRLFPGVLLIFGIVTLANAAERTPYGILENVCTASRLDGDVIRSNVRVFADANGMKMMEMPIESLRIALPDAVTGWGIQEGQDQFIVAFGTRTTSDGTSRSCSISVQENKLDNWKAYVETKYRSTKIADQDQGNRRFIAYRTMLVGFEKPLYISLQGSTTASPQFTSMALFETPSKR